MDKIELLQAIGGNKELAEKIIQLWKADAPAEEFAALLAEAGLSADLPQVEEILAEAQEKRAQKIALEKLDDDEMAKVTGGDLSCNNVAHCFADWACDTAWNNCILHDNCLGNSWCNTNAGCALPSAL